MITGEERKLLAHLLQSRRALAREAGLAIHWTEDARRKRDLGLDALTSFLLGRRAREYASFLRADVRRLEALLTSEDAHRQALILAARWRRE